MLPGKKYYLRVFVLLLGLTFGNLNLNLVDSVEDHSNDDQQQASKIALAPKDYSYSPEASRVRDLAGFFESMQRRNSDPTVVGEKQDLIISLSEAASKLHLLLDGFPLEIKCNRYVKLIDRPNIRTFATVNLLANEDKSFNEIEQNDVNLLSRLQNERLFDALSKSQTIIQSLESERNNMRSAYEPEVQQDLLECINYYIYRHQRATLGLIEYVRETRSKVPQTLTPGRSKAVLERYRELLDTIEGIEKKEHETGQKDDRAWLEKFAKMYDLVQENEFEMPKLVQNFVTESTRLERLRALDQVLSQVGEIEKTIHELESSKTEDGELSKNAEYRQLLVKLFDMVTNWGDLLPENLRKLVEDSTRKSLVEDELERNKLNQHDENEELESKTEAPPETDRDESDMDDEFEDAHEDWELRQDSSQDQENLIEQGNSCARGSKIGLKNCHEIEDEPHKERNVIEKSIATMTNEMSRHKDEMGICRKYIVGFDRRRTLDMAFDDIVPKSACTKRAHQIRADLRSFDDTGLEFKWARSMTDSMSRFMIDCLMRPNY